MSQSPLMNASNSASFVGPHVDPRENRHLRPRRAVGHVAQVRSRPYGVRALGRHHGRGLRQVGGVAGLAKSPCGRARASRTARTLEMGVTWATSKGSPNVAVRHDSRQVCPAFCRAGMTSLFWNSIYAWIVPGLRVRTVNDKVARPAAPTARARAGRQARRDTRDPITNRNAGERWDMAVCLLWGLTRRPDRRAYARRRPRTTRESPVRASVSSASR